MKHPPTDSKILQSPSAVMADGEFGFGVGASRGIKPAAITVINTRPQSMRWVWMAPDAGALENAFANHSIRLNFVASWQAGVFPSAQAGCPSGPLLLERLVQFPNNGVSGHCLSNRGRPRTALAPSKSHVNETRFCFHTVIPYWGS